MCGRFGFSLPRPEAMALFGLAEADEYVCGHNLAPGAHILTIRAEPGIGLTGRLLRWGLVPHWAKDPALGSRLFNARSETAAQKPSFRDAWRQRRCLVPADVFYEWTGPAARRLPYAFFRPDRAPFTMAGLWERWTGPSDVELFTVTILTVAADAVVAPVHERMPLVLDPRARSVWLDTDSSPERLQALLASASAAELCVRQTDPQAGNPLASG